MALKKTIRGGKMKKMVTKNAVSNGGNIKKITTDDVVIDRKLFDFWVLIKSGQLNMGDQERMANLCRIGDLEGGKKIWVKMGLDPETFEKFFNVTQGDINQQLLDLEIKSRDRTHLKRKRPTDYGPLSERPAYMRADAE